MPRRTDRLWVSYGRQIRDARLSRGWSVSGLAERAGISEGMLYRVEAGEPASTDLAQALAGALGKRAQLSLIDPRRRPDARTNLSVDPVHSAMGEFEVRHLRSVGVRIGLDEPYQHYQFAGRADLVAWDVTRAAVLHIENRTRFPDFQEMAGSYNAKRAYLAESVGQRLGVRRWASQTHVIAALWSGEILHALRLRAGSFQSLCPDPPDGLLAWWRGEPPETGTTSTLIVLDPSGSGRQRAFVGLDVAIAGTRPRYRGYAEALAAIESAA